MLYDIEVAQRQPEMNILVRKTSTKCQFTIIGINLPNSIRGTPIVYIYSHDIGRITINNQMFISQDSEN